MIILPFLIFLVITVFYIKKYGFNIGSLLLLLYTISFAAAIPLYYAFDVYSDIEISFFSMIYLVFLLLLWLSPILIFSTRDYSLNKDIPFKKFNIFSYVLIFISIITYIFLLPNGINNIISPDISSIRADSMNGDAQIFTDNALINFIISNFLVFYPISLFFLFYSVAFMQRNKMFNLLLFFSSTSVIIFSFLYVARGDIVYWSLMFVFLYVFFRKYIDAKQRKLVLLPFFVAISLGIIYFSIISLARFENSDNGTLFGILDYWGQPAINFGYFFDHFTQFQHGTLNFPFFQRILGLPHREGINDYFDVVGSQSDFFIGVFFTFIGSFFIDFGAIGTFVLTIIGFVFGLYVFRTSNEIPFYRMFLMILYCQIPLQGLFIFNLLNDGGNKYIILTILLCILFKYSVRIKT